MAKSAWTFSCGTPAPKAPEGRKQIRDFLAHDQAGGGSPVVLSLPVNRPALLAPLAGQVAEPVLGGKPALERAVASLTSTVEDLKRETVEMREELERQRRESEESEEVCLARGRASEGWRVGG